jgi:polyhydroxyalkanoate synthesis regulator phasin
MNDKKITDFNQKDLDGMVEQATRLGIGFAIVSKEALEDIIKKTSAENGVSETEAKQAINDLVNESKRREKQLKEKVKAVIKTAKANSPVVSRTEILKMKAEITKLKQQLKKKNKR